MVTSSNLVRFSTTSTYSHCPSSVLSSHALVILFDQHYSTTVSTLTKHRLGVLCAPPSCRQAPTYLSWEAPNLALYLIFNSLFDSLQLLVNYTPFFPCSKFCDSNAIIRVYDGYGGPAYGDISCFVSTKFLSIDFTHTIGASGSNYQHVGVVSGSGYMFRIERFKPT